MPASTDLALAGLLITPTRLGWWLRLRTVVRAAYLRWLIRVAEFDLQHQQDDLERLPHELDLGRRRLAELRVALIDCELCREGLS